MGLGVLLLLLIEFVTQKNQKSQFVKKQFIDLSCTYHLFFINELTTETENNGFSKIKFGRLFSKS